MRFIIDVNVGRSIEKILIERGFDVISVRDIDPRMTDAEILNRAVKDDRIVVTQDKDFGELIYNSGKLHAGVLLLRMEGESRESRSKLFQEIIEKHIHILANHFCVYHNSSLRVKK